MLWNADRPLFKLEKGLVYVFFLGLIPAFGVLVECRTVFLERRMGDLDVFLRAAWAIRTGADPYAVTSDNDWHYIYPPLTAILLTPLADPPNGQDSTGYLPFPVSAALCYLLSVLSLVWAAHHLASALEQTGADPAFAAQPHYCLRWWALRLWPVYVCILPIGHTLARGQVNLAVLAMLCAALAGWLRGQNFRAGIWLAFAICIKVIPVYLVVYPLWKRDGRGLLGCAAGLLAGLVVIPVLASGPSKTLTQYHTYATVFFGPLLNINDDPSRAEEILGHPNATESVGVKNAIFNWMYPDPYHRPANLPAIGKAVYVLLGITMTLLTLWPGTFHYRRSSTAEGLVQESGVRNQESGIRSQGSEARGHSGNLFAALILLMAIFSPICHSHYLMFCVPIVMSLLASHWQFQTTVRLPWLVTMSFAVFFVTMAVAYLPGMEILKDRCASLFAALPLWGIPVAQLWLTMGNSPIVPQTESRAAA